MAENSLGGISWTVDADTKGAVNSTKQLDTQVDEAEGSLKKLDKQTDKTAKSLNSKLTPAAKGVNKAVAGMGRKAGQAGIQMQQFIGQIQGGQNAMLALSAQSADLGFVLGAPLIGAIAGISASVAGLLLPSLFNGKKAAEELETALEALKEMTYETADGTLTLSKQIEKLAKKSEEAAKVELALGIVKAREAIKNATKEVEEATRTWESFFTMAGLDNAIGELGNLEAVSKRTGETQIEVLKRLGDSYEGGLAGIGGLSKAVDSLGEEYGLTNTQALGFLKSVKQFEKTKSPETMQALAVVLSDIAVSADKPNKKLLELSKRINTASISATNANDVIKLFDEALKDLGKALDEDSESASKLTGKVSAMVSALQEQAKALNETNRQTALRIALESKATAAQLASINAAFDSIEAKQKQIKTQKELDAQMNASFNAEVARERKNKAAKETETKRAITTTESIISRGETPEERMQNERDLVESFREDNLITAKQYQDALTQIDEEGANARAQISAMAMGSFSNSFGEIANVLKNSEGEQSSAYKAMFALSKGFAVAQAGLNLAIAISNASAVTPWYASLPAVASVVAAGAGMISAVAGATYSGRENGGSVIGGQTYEVGEKNKPELLMIPGNKGKVFSNSETKGMMGGGGGYQPPIINNYVSGSGVSVEHRRDELTKRDVFDIVQNEMTNPNSKGRRGMQRNSNVHGILNGGRRT